MILYVEVCGELVLRLSHPQEDICKLFNVPGNIR